jgi:signal transduction histidine kinase
MNPNLNMTDKETILIIDDSPDNLNLLSRILSDAGYKVNLAPSGKLAFRFMESHRPDLILLDIMMPNMDGYAVCEEIKKSTHNQDIPIIFISALPEVFDKVKAFSLGGVDYITKPFQEQEVLVRVQNQLRIRRLAKQIIDQNILEERNRMAREIHDTLAQTFTGIILHLGVAERAMATAPEQALLHIQTVRELARSGLAEARRSVEALRSQVLEDGDLYCALNRVAKPLSSDTNTRTVLEIIGTAYPLPLEVENNLLRIGQEALTNAFKYAQASLIKIELIYETEIFRLRVKDNGKGFDPDRIYFSNGFGFLGMQERARRLGAELAINSHPAEGTEIIVSINWKQ